MAPPSEVNAQALSPNGLVEQLFNAAFMQSPTDPRQAAQRVVGYLTDALLYAVASSKNDVIVFLTQTLVYVVASSSEDEVARREVLKRVSETIAAAADQPPQQPQQQPPRQVPVAPLPGGKKP